VYQVYVHNCYFGLPKYLSYIFINPDLHKIHHDEHESSQKSNYGAMLVIWDKLFKTYKDNVGNIKIGNKDDNEENFLKNQAKPFIYFYKKIF
jgi:sterol desaturase/sphingolipid hydroxylase (fatty acid hydroxylase superfamily)